MGSWNESIYGNDVAQDFLGLLNDLHKQQLKIDGIILKAKESHLYNYNEAKLVLADFEIDLAQNISNKNDLKSAIREELDMDTLDNWTEPDKRENEILIFNYKLKDYVYEHKDISNSEVRNWLDNKRGMDII